MTNQEDTLLESMKEEIASAGKPEEEAKEDQGATDKEQEVQETTDEESDETTDENKDETSAEKAADENAESDEPSEKPRGRANDTIRALKEERKRDREELERITTERATVAAQLEFERRRQFEVQSEQQRKQEEERLALLDPTERAIYQSNKRANELEYRLNVMQIQIQQSADKSAFEAKASADPLYAKYGSEVEKLYQEGLKRGVTAPREELLNLVLGRELRKDISAKHLSKKEAAGKRIDSVTSRPAKAKSDVSGSRKGQTEEDRLRGMII